MYGRSSPPTSPEWPAGRQRFASIRIQIRAKQTEQPTLQGGRLGAIAGMYRGRNTFFCETTPSPLLGGRGSCLTPTYRRAGQACDVDTAPVAPGVNTRQGSAMFLWRIVVQYPGVAFIRAQYAPQAACLRRTSKHIERWL